MIFPNLFNILSSNVVTENKLINNCELQRAMILINEKYRSINVIDNLNI